MNTLAAELNYFKGQFSLIGITETNVDSCNKDHYPLDSFKSYYNDKLPNKLIGTGVALYIYEYFNALLIYEEVKTNLSHLGTLFVKTINAGVHVVFECKINLLARTQPPGQACA